MSEIIADPKDSEYTFEAPTPYRDPELARGFDQQADYVATPAAMGG